MVGVTVIVAIIGKIVVFTAVKAGIAPVPLAANPMVVSSFVQSNVTPVVALVKVAVGTVTPLQNAALTGVLTVGVASTKIV